MAGQDVDTIIPWRSNRAFGDGRYIGCSKDNDPHLLVHSVSPKSHAPPMNVALLTIHAWTKQGLRS